MMTSAGPASTRAKFNLLNLVQVPIFQQLQIEEALLRADTGNWCILNRDSPAAIVMGISGIQEKLIDVRFMQQHPVPVIRRFSGGGTVFIDQNTVFATFICNAADLQVACYPHHVHQWMANFYKKSFPQFEMHLRENDYVIGERKWGGNAQYLSKGRWLHHTSMLWDFDQKNMDYLLMPAKIPAYRQARVHRDFMCTLREHFSEASKVNIQIINQLKQQFEVDAMSLQNIKEIIERPHRKATVILN